MSDIDFPVDSAKVDTYLAGDEPVDENGVGSLGADVRGINAIEHVLFGANPTAGRPCEYMVSAAGLVLTGAERVLDAWTSPTDDTPSFAAQISDPGADGSMYADVAEVYADIVNNIIFALGDVGDRRLGRASGDVTGSPVPAEVDAGRARRALLDTSDILDGVVEVYRGGRGADDDAPAGIRAVVASMSEDAAEALDEQFAAAAAAIDAIPAPLADNTDPVPVHDAYEAVRTAQVTMSTEVASLLGVTLTFGDADGDS
jgi:predicted lipoprotein